MTDCNQKDCNTSFAQEHQGLLRRVCELENTIFADKFVRVSINDPLSGYLGDKLIGVSGINFTEAYDGVSGYVYKASLDLNFLDNRYLNQGDSILNFDLNSSNRNGYTQLNLINCGLQSITFLDNKKGYASWTYKIPKNFLDGNTSLNLSWVTENGASGIVLFEIDYSSLIPNEILTYDYTEIISGYSDGVPLKIYESTLDITSGIISKDDIFFLKITRRGDLSEDSIYGDIDLVNVSLNYIQT